MVRVPVFTSFLLDSSPQRSCGVGVRRNSIQSTSVLIDQKTKRSGRGGRRVHLRPDPNLDETECNGKRSRGRRGRAGVRTHVDLALPTCENSRVPPLSDLGLVGESGFQVMCSEGLCEVVGKVFLLVETGFTEGSLRDKGGGKESRGQRSRG